MEAAGLNLQGLTDPNTAIMLHVEGTDNHSNDAPTNSDWQSWWYKSGGATYTDANKLQHTVTPVSGTYTVTTTANYTIELYGGNGAAAGLSCADGIAGFGGKGGYIAVSMNLKQGDVIRYEVASGGIKAQRPTSQAYHDEDDHISIGANGQDTKVYVNNKLVAVAFGGLGAYRFCHHAKPDRDFYWVMDSMTHDWANARNGSYSGGRFTGDYRSISYLNNATSEAAESDDGAFGGLGGYSWCDSSVCSLVRYKNGENGNCTLLSNNVTNVQSGLALQAWYNLWGNYYRDQMPGMFIMSMNHTHDFSAASSSCTKDGTPDKVCSLCGGTQYGMEWIPAHGHNFVPIEIGTPGYECTPNSTYYLSHDNSRYNTQITQYKGADGWFYTYQCTYCKGMADPKPGLWYIDYHNTNGSTGTIPRQSIQFNQTASLSDGTAMSLRHSVLTGWSTSSNPSRDINPTVTYKLSQQVRDLVAPGKVLDLYAVWRPWWYRVTYHNNIPGQPDSTTTRNDVQYEYDVDYVPMKASEAPWSREGYYIDRWSISPQLRGQGYTSNHPDSTGGASTFRNMAADTQMAHLYAIWRGNPYKLLIHDNYKSCKCAIEEYSLHVDESFTLPKHDNVHNKSAVLLGYSPTPAYTLTPQYKVGSEVLNLTKIAHAEVHLYRIWDEIPTIQSPPHLKIDKDTAKAAGIVIENGTVKQSDLELLLLNYVTAQDYEWSQRYHTENIPTGSHNNYKVKVASIDPVQMREDMDKNAVNYVITYMVTDDAGNSATSVTELFFGDPSSNPDDWVTILKDTN